MKKIIIGDKVWGAVEVPETPNAYTIFHAVRKAYGEGLPLPLTLPSNSSRAGHSCPAR